MGSYDNIVKIEEIRKRMEEGNAPSAQKILDTMDLKKIKNIADLSMIAEVYTENERYEEATELLEKLFNKTKARKALYQLIWVSIKANKPEDAQEYLKQYEKIAPKDFYNLIFRFKIDKLKGEPYEKQIETLETLKKTEYMEEWAYELAKLYYKVGMEQQCIRECSDIILWFGEGIYVEKAKMLRAYFSGETDKDKIIEELKRRAMNEKESVIQDAVTTDYDSSSNLINNDYIETSVTGDNALLNSNEITVEIDSSDLADDLRKDVQNMLDEEWNRDDLSINDGFDQSDEESQPDQENEYIQDGDIYREDASCQEESYVVEAEFDSDVRGNHAYSSSEEREQAENEVETMLYQLLEQEDLDEEDGKLSQMAESFNFNPDELFGDFLQTKTIKKELVKSLEYILDEHTRMVQIIITGTAGSGKTTLAKEIALFLNKTGKLRTSKIAKIQAERLNSIDIMSKKDTLKDCCLVVEHASELKRATIDKILELGQYFHGDMAVIFEEDKKNLSKLFRECPKSMDLFKNRIHLQQ